MVFFYLLIISDWRTKHRYSEDPCHDYAWILDTAINDGVLSDVLLRDMESATAKLGSVPDARVDEAMLLANPHATHAILRTLCEKLLACAATRVLPVASPPVDVLLKLLHKALWARRCAQESSVTQPNVAVLRSLCPWLVSLAVDAQLAGDGDVDGDAVPEEVRELCMRDVAARKVLLAFATMLVHKGEPHGLRGLLALASQCFVAAEDAAFLQSLVSSCLVPHAQGPRAAKWQVVLQIVMEAFLGPASRYGLVAHRQCLRFALGLVHRVPVAALLSFLAVVVERADPAQHTDQDLSLAYVELLEQLVPSKVEDDAVLFVLQWLHMIDAPQDSGAPQDAGEVQDNGEPSPMIVE